MIVDVHVHVIVRELRPHVSPPPSAVGEFVDPEGILAAAARAGIDHVVLSPWVQLLSGDLERCRMQNDALAEIVLSEPRLSAFGALPLHEPRIAVRELREVMGAKVLSGVEVPASVGGAYLGDERFEPFWRRPRRPARSSSSTRPRAGSTTRCSATSTSGTPSATRSRPRSAPPRW
jgi:predicted TIM-barrel fold metal-dependent hydrolase